jgi:hypothetical protein
MLTHKVLLLTLLVLVLKVTLDIVQELKVLYGVTDFTLKMSVSCVLLMLVFSLNSQQELFKNMI